MVSVIIPVYRAERFLDECLESVVEQDYPALEIILVDDGSPDSCPEMCDRYAKAYECIKTIHKKNEGSGVARNTGIDAATGKYIAFVDSDDRLDGANAIRRLVEQAEGKQADIVVGSYRSLIGQRPGGINDHRLEGGIYTETVDFRFKGFILYNILPYPWGKLYRRSFILEKGLKFPNYPFAQDKSFNMTCCANKPVYAFVDESVYLYRSNGDSVTHRYWDNYISVYIAVASDFERLLSERGMTEEYSDLIAFHLCFGLFSVATQELQHKGLPETWKALSKYGREPLVHKMVKRLAGGRYIGQLDRKAWKVKAMIWGAATLCSVHAYAPLALGMWVLWKVKAVFPGFYHGLIYGTP